MCMQMIVVTGTVHPQNQKHIFFLWSVLLFIHLDCFNVSWIVVEILGIEISAFFPIQWHEWRNCGVQYLTLAYRLEEAGHQTTDLPISSVLCIYSGESCLIFVKLSSSREKQFKNLLCHHNVKSVGWEGLVDGATGRNTTAHIQLTVYVWK